MSPEFCIIAALVLFVLAWYAHDWYRAYLLSVYGRQAENLYVISKRPNDRSVYQRAEAHQRLLVEAQNDLRVQVHMLIFQEGEHVNENWGEFEARVRAFIAEDRKARHVWLRENRRLWYLKEVKGISGIELDQV